MMLYKNLLLLLVAMASIAEQSAAEEPDGISRVKHQPWTLDLGALKKILEKTGRYEDVKRDQIISYESQNVTGTYKWVTYRSTVSQPNLCHVFWDFAPEILVTVDCEEELTSEA